MESTIYTVGGKKFELQHHGVKGMKWGRRKTRPQSTGTGRRGSQANTDSAQSEAARKEARRAKAKKAAKVGAAVVGTALAAYGAKKLHDVVRDKNYQYRMKQGSKAIDAYLKRVEDLRYHDDWRVRMRQEDRDRQFMELVYGDASRQADKDSFRVAAENVLYDYLDKRQNRR